MMENTQPHAHRVNPHVSVDCVIVGFDGEELKVLLVRQMDQEPSQAYHDLKLPGSLIYEDEDLDEAATRVLYEQAGIRNLSLVQFHAFGSKDRTRNPKDVKWLERFHRLDRQVDRIVTIAYLTLVTIDKRLTRLSDRYEACWMRVDEMGQLAFDHNEIIAEALRYIRQYAEANPSVLFDLLPRKFTAAQLRRLYERVYDKMQDVRNFHKKLAQMDYVTPLEEWETGVSHRAARYYRFDRKVYNKIHGISKSFQA